jgi:hypothetical protein
MEHFVGVVDAHYVLMGALQGGATFEQVVSEMVLNGHPAVRRAGVENGEIRLEVRAESAFAKTAAAASENGGLSVSRWTEELSCVDNGTGISVQAVRERLGVLGSPTSDSSQRSFFGRGIRDAWLAAGAGHLFTICEGVATEAVFYRTPTDPFAYSIIRSAAASEADRKALGFPSGTRVVVPIREPLRHNLRYVLSNLVQLRPVFEDASCRVALKVPGKNWQRLRFELPEIDPERTILADEEVQLDATRSAHIIVKRSLDPVGRITSQYGKGGLVVRSRWAAHELTLGSFGHSEGAKHLFGEVWCDALDELQYEARNEGRPELVVRVDRKGLNRDHRLVARLFEAIDAVLEDIVALEEARAKRRVQAVGDDTEKLDRAGLAHLNEAVSKVFQVGRGGGARPGVKAQAPQPAVPDAEDLASDLDAGDEPLLPLPTPTRPSRPPDTPLYFSKRYVRMPPATRREVQLHSAPDIILPGTDVTLEVVGSAKSTIRAIVKAGDPIIKEPGKSGVSSTGIRIQVYANARPGTDARLTARAGTHEATLQIGVAGAGGEGYFSKLVRVDEDNAERRATVEEATGEILVYVGRSEFKDLERLALQLGHTKKTLPMYLPYRFAEVEAALDACWWWAADKLLEPDDDSADESAIRDEANRIRSRAHHAALQAFLGPDVMGVRPLS